MMMVYLSYNSKAYRDEISILGMNILKIEPLQTSRPELISFIIPYDSRCETVMAGTGNGEKHGFISSQISSQSLNQLSRSEKKHINE